MHKIAINKTSCGRGNEQPDILTNGMTGVFSELEKTAFAVLETYSNVHRGSGHKSLVSTHLYELARDIVLDYLGLSRGKYVVIFCSPARAETFKAQLAPESYKSVSSRERGLPLGIWAMAVKRKALPGGTPFQTGGGNARLVSPGWVIWADAPDRFEAGTPSIVNVIAFARALQLTSPSGKNNLPVTAIEKTTATDILYRDELEGYSGQKLLDELRKTLIGRNVNVPTSEGMKPYINLDNAASTPTFTPVLNAVRQTWCQSEIVQKEIIQEVRSICAMVLGAPLTGYDIIFTSNTTEAINLAAENLKLDYEPDTEPVVLSTILEHTSDDLPWRMDKRFQMIRLQVDVEGFVDLNGLDDIICNYNEKGLYGKKRIKLIAVSGASNVLGVFNDLEEIGRIVNRHGVLLLVDAAQMIAHREVDMERCGIDYLAFSAHKVYAPFGTGVLAVRKGMLNFSSSELESIRASGEENTGGIAALGKALVILQRIGMDTIREEEQALTRRALHGLSKIPNLRIYGVKDPDSPGFARKGGVIAFDLKNTLSSRVGRVLAEKGGIGVRWGCHCAHILIKQLVGVPRALERFQGFMAIVLPKLRFPGLVRISLGIGNSENDIDALIQVLSDLTRKNGTRVNKDVRREMDDFVRAVSLRVYGRLKRISLFSE